MNSASNYRVGKYIISDVCRQTYPCKHSFINTETNTNLYLSGDEIYNILKRDGLSHPHFNEYAYYNMTEDNNNITYNHKRKNKGCIIC